jgi:hypothetical protein
LQICNTGLILVLQDALKAEGRLYTSCLEQNTVTCQQDCVNNLTATVLKKIMNLVKGR